MTPASARLTWEKAQLTPSRDTTVEELASATDRTVRIDVLAQTTWRPIASFLRGELACEGIAAELRFFENEQLEAAIAHDQEPVHAAVLALDDPERWDGILDRAAPFDDETVSAFVEGVRTRVERTLERARCAVVVWPAIDTGDVFPLDSLEGTDRTTRVGTLRGALRCALHGVPGAHFIDLPTALAELGRARAFDPRLWQIGRIAYSEQGFAAIARTLLPPLLLGFGQGIKAVVVDLDHTLWGGVVGERGARGVEIDPPRAALQRELKRWKDAGILLALASKNSADDARGPFEEHVDMHLAWEDFSAHEAHWDPKPESVRRIIETFGIGHDAVLFLDDNPREREAVRTGCPGVRVPELPDDPAEWLAVLRTMPWPLFVSESDEDRRRAELQSQRAERRRATEAAGDPTDHLRSLAIELEVDIDVDEAIERVARMHAKTNQFNLDPVRLGEHEIRAAAADPDRAVVSARYRDRFGDAGIIAAAVIDRTSDALRAETFLLSCRVIGLGVEHAFLAEIGRRLGDDRSEIALPFRTTDRNEPARRFLTDLLGAPPPEGGCAVPRAQWPACPEWIAIAAPVGEGEPA